MTQKVIRQGITPQVGTGKPDYTREVSSGEIRPGLRLKPNQQLIFFIYVPQDIVAVPYAIPWIQSLLAPFPAVARLIDSDTGIATPYTLAQGYRFRMIEGYWTFNQDAELWVYFDGFLINCTFSGSSGSYGEIGPIVGFDTIVFDPTAAVAHTFDMMLVNRGVGNMRGEASFTVLIEAVGTPPFPVDKNCKCPFCKTINRVSTLTTMIKCQKCGNSFLVTSHLPGGRIK